ncbi:MAG: hypothetical protein EZS28_040715, partial [Streblomastix strix]
MTLGTSQTITANKTLNNSCRFVSSIDGMSTVTGSSFIKSGADNTVVLLGAGGTKPIAEFGGSVDDSNYVKKTGQPLQVIREYIRKSMQDVDYEPSEEDEDYITKGEVENQYVSLGGNQQIIGTKSFYDNVTANGFVKKDGTNQQLLLVNGTTKPLSEFTGIPTDLSNYYTKTQTYSQTEANNKFVRLEGSVQQTITGRLKYVSPFDYQDETQDPVANTYLTMSEVDAKLTNVVSTNTTQSITGAKTFNENVNVTGFVKTYKDDTSVLLAGGGDALLSSFGGVTGISPPTPPSTTYPIQLATKRMTLTCSHSYREIRITTDSTEAWIYIDEALLDAAGLMDFPESYAYIKERDSQPPVGVAHPVPIDEQTLQEQVKVNADILENTNEVFVPPEPNMPIKIDYGQQIVNKPFIFNEMQPTLIVYGDRVTLNCFVTI